MRIAILSDSHDHIPNLRAAITYCNAYGVALVIHCGDLISPFMLKELAAFNGPVHLVYGNNVGDKHLISQSCGLKYPSISHHGELGAVEAGGLKIAINHFPILARAIAKQGGFDLVCCGHNHRCSVEQHGETLLINPGELHGGKEQPGFIIFDTVSRQPERVDIGEPFATAEDPAVKHQF